MYELPLDEAPRLDPPFRDSSIVRQFLVNCGLDGWVTEVEMFYSSYDLWAYFFMALLFLCLDLLDAVLGTAIMTIPPLPYDIYN